MRARGVGVGSAGQSSSGVRGGLLPSGEEAPAANGEGRDYRPELIALGLQLIAMASLVVIFVEAA